MATAHLSTNYDHAATADADTFAEGVLVSASMLGAVGGALMGAALTTGLFEYADVLFGTLGVILGSLVAGTVGRCAILPALTALAHRRS